MKQLKELGIQIICIVLAVLITVLALPFIGALAIVVVAALPLLLLLWLLDCGTK